VNIIQVFCDDCHEYVRTPVDDENDRDATNVQLFGYGWRKKGLGQQWCPEHAQRRGIA
jgi:hypothetical protein